MTEYRYAPEVDDIVAELIDAVPQHKPLADVRIDVVYRDRHSKSKGRRVLAKARKVGGLNAYLIQPDAEQRDLFVLEVADDLWDKLSFSQRKALVDHELCHMRVDRDDEGTPQLSIVGHDLEEFGCVVERHGLWLSSTAEFGSKVADQIAKAVNEVTEFVEQIGDQTDVENGDGPGEADVENGDGPGEADDGPGE